MDLEQFEGHVSGPWYFWNNCGGAPGVGIGPTEELNVGVGFYETPEEMVSALLMASAPELLAHAKALEAKVEALEKALVEIRGWREIGRADTAREKLPAREKLTAIEEICDQALTQSTEPEGDEDKSHV